MITSFMYHCCDSIDAAIWLSEGQWHRLDNVGSIMSFICWIVYLMDLRDRIVHHYVLYISLGVVLALQEKAPWDERYTIVPILLMFVALVATCAGTRRVPPYDHFNLKRGLSLLGIGFLCFLRGLDDATDPFRFFHGCWHAFVGISAYYNWKVLRGRQKDDLPTTSRNL